MILLTWILGIAGTLGTAGTIAAFIFFPTIAAPILAKVTQAVLACKTCLIVAAFVIATLGAFWYGHHGAAEEFGKGWSAAIAAIASEDANAIQDATDKRTVWQECRAKNGAWDQSTGECK
jgi:nitrate/nitrite transporter NarK